MRNRDEIRIQGCVKRGVEAGCIILVTGQKKEYSLHGKSLPTLGKGLGVSATGKVIDADTCQQGTPFEVSSWNWTRLKCPKEESTSTEKSAAGKCSGWKAWHDRMPGGSATLHVQGKCTFPTTGYKVKLVPHVPQGINPAVYILDRVVQVPTGLVSQMVTTEKVEYEEKTNAHYQEVYIEPDGVTIPVKEVQ